MIGGLAMTDKPKRFVPPYKEVRIVRPVFVEKDPLLDNNPDLDPDFVERMLPRIGEEEVLADHHESRLAWVVRLMAPSGGKAPLVLRLAAATLGEYDDYSPSRPGFCLLIAADPRPGIVACATAALAAEGFPFATAVRLWNAEKAVAERPSADGEKPLFVAEIEVEGPLPAGVATPEEASARLLARMRPAFDLLRQDVSLALARAAAPAALPEVPASGVNEILSPR
jgi:hypothetical protein